MKVVKSRHGLLLKNIKILKLIKIIKTSSFRIIRHQFLIVHRTCHRNNNSRKKNYIRHLEIFNQEEHYLFLKI